MPGRLVRGRFKKSEMDFLRANAKTMSLEVLAETLCREPETIRSWVKENLAIDIGGEAPVTLEEMEIRNRLRESPDWLELKDQFVETELERFEYKYAKLMSQFDNNVLPTEENQIFMLIKFDIIISRNFKARQRALADVDRLTATLEKLYEDNKDKQPLEQAVRDRMTNLESQLASAKAAEESKTGELIKLTEKYNAILKDLKGTREQRITKVENAKESFLSLLKALQEDEMRSAAGEDMELLRMATLKEKERLAKPHRYVDDTVDQPLLTPETVLAGDSNE